jgi:hypothetical protein
LLLLRLLRIRILRTLLIIPLCTAGIIGAVASPAAAATTTVSGTVTFGPTNGVQSVCVYLLSTDSDGSDYAAQTLTNGSYSISGVNVDTYLIQFDPSCGGTIGSPFAGEWFVGGSTAGTPNAADATVLSLDGGAEIADAILTQGAMLQGVINTSNGVNEVGGCVYAFDTTNGVDLHDPDRQRRRRRFPVSVPRRHLRRWY